MDETRLFKAGIWGAVVTAICCFTPILVVVLGLIGLAALTAYLDYVLLPVLALFLIVIFYAWLKQRRRR